MSTYPNEVWPSDAQIEALDGTMDQATGLPYVPKGAGPTSSPTYEVQYNRRQQRANGILTTGRAGMVVAEGGLKIGVYPLSYTQSGTRKTFTGASDVSVTDDSTYVVYIDAANTLQVAASWPADMRQYVPLAEVTAADGSVTAVTDVRLETLYVVPEFVDKIRPMDLETDLVHAIPYVDITVGSESADTITVTLQVRDADDNALAERCSVRCWLADSAGGAATSTAPGGTVSWTTGTVIDEKTAKVHWRSVMTDASGTAVLSITESGDRSWYLHVELDGKVVVSDEIDFNT